MKISLLNKLLVLAIFACGGFLSAQTITGTVIGDGVPLLGASVVVKGTQNGVTTNYDGQYTLNNVAPDAILIFSYVGYRTTEVPVDSRSIIDVALPVDANLLDEVIVVGYGTQKRSDVTTAISTVTAEEIKSIPVADIGQTLQGRAAGVNVVNGGSPGQKTQVRIRGFGTFGDGDPLYVIDGVFTNSINNIDPNSIKKIDILKDAAAAAIYGSRGSNGVIIITTDRGRPGKTSFKVNSYAGVQSSNQRYDLLNTSQYIQYISEINAQADGGGTFVGIVNDNPNFDGNGIETDWQDELFRSAAITSVNVSASGGNENATYSFGASVFDQDGVYIDTNFKRRTFNAASQFNVTDKFRVGETFALGFTDRIAPQVSDGREPLFNVLASAPYTPVRNPDGSFSGSTDADANNSRNQIRVQNSDDNLTRNTSIIGSLYAEYDLLEGMTFRSQFGLDAFYSLQDNILRAYDEGGQFSKPDTNVSKIRANQISTIFTNSLNYSKSFADVHNFDATLVYERQDTRFQTLQAASINAISSEIPELVASGAATTSATEDEILISYLGRLNYNYDSRYLFSASVRRDKSSRFAPGVNSDFFPAVSAGWVVSKEQFFEKYDFINNLKLTASYGETGNNRIPRNTFRSGLASVFNYPINGQLALGFAPRGADNFDLTWELSSKQNYGMEVAFLQNQITFSADYYNSNNKRVLITENAIPSVGVSGGASTGGPVSRNAAELEVSGFDFTVGYNDYVGEFKWNLWASLTTSKTNVNDIGNAEQILRAQFLPIQTQLSRLAVGQPINHFFGFVYEGVYSTNQDIIDDLGADNLIGSGSDAAYQVQQGDARYRDINGDGDITSEDRVVIGDPNPDFIYSVNLKAEYKNFDFSALLTGVQGVDAFNGNIFNLESQENVLNRGVAVLDRWQQPGDVTDVPRFRFGQNQNNAVSTRYIEDASYARLRNLTVGYTLPSEISDKVLNGALAKVRIYAQALNLFTITGYSGLDPEIEPFYNAAGIIEGINIDRGRSPQPRSFITGLQIEF